MFNVQSYEVINPIAGIHLYALNHEVAACALLIVSDGRFGADLLDEDGPNVPMFPSGGGREWFEATFGRTLEQSVRMQPKAVGEALMGFAYFETEERKRLLYTDEDICSQAFNMGLRLFDKFGLKPWFLDFVGDDEYYDEEDFAEID